MYKSNTCKYKDIQIIFCTNCQAGFNKTIHTREIIYLREHLQVRALRASKDLGNITHGRGSNHQFGNTRSLWP